MTSNGVAGKIGRRIRTRREATGVSQSELQRLTGLATEVISRFENGHNAPSASTLMDLSRALRTSVGYLLGVESAQ